MSAQGPTGDIRNDTIPIEAALLHRNQCQDRRDENRGATQEEHNVCPLPGSQARSEVQGPNTVTGCVQLLGGSKIAPHRSAPSSEGDNPANGLQIWAQAVTSEPSVMVFYLRSVTNYGTDKLKLVA